MITVEFQCPMCGREYEVDVPIEAFFAWQSGALIQEAMPNASATVREHFVSGLCEDCQESIFTAYERIKNIS